MLGFGLGLNKWRRVGGSFVGLLDLFPGAAAAYSLRLLRKDYSGGLVRARAWDGSANQGEADVMAYRVSATEYVLDLNSTLENLDATAISRGLTTSDTLADLVSTGVNDYDGLTSAWYDQSLSNDATQTTAADQPKIVSSGSLVTENGKPAIDFDGVDDRFSYSATFNANSMFVVSEEAQNFLSHGISYIRITTSGIVYRSDGFYQFDFSAPTSGQQLNSVIGDGVNNNAYKNSVASLDNPTLGNVFAINGIVNIGSVGASFSNFSMQELIFYPSDQSTNRTGIETNINNFYSIY